MKEDNENLKILIHKEIENILTLFNTTQISIAKKNTLILNETNNLLRDTSFLNREYAWFTQKLIQIKHYFYSIYGVYLDIDFKSFNKKIERRLEMYLSLIIEEVLNSAVVFKNQTIINLKCITDSGMMQITFKSNSFTREFLAINFDLKASNMYTRIIKEAKSSFKLNSIISQNALHIQVTKYAI